MHIVERHCPVPLRRLAVPWPAPRTDVHLLSPSLSVLKSHVGGIGGTKPV